MRTSVWYLLFTFSGAAAILYEVVFNKYVSYVFGSTAYATSTVLAAYMGGLSIGSFVGGRIADRTRRPLLLYGIMELAAGAYFYFSIGLLERLGAFQARLYDGHSIAPLTVYQFVSCFVLVLVPTVFLGATFPLVVRGLMSESSYGSLVSRLYFSNLVGTASGAVVAAYGLVPKLGLRGTLRVSVGIAAALLVVVVLMESARRGGASQDEEVGGAAAAEPQPSMGLSYREILILAFVSGFTVFGYEVVWTHLYALLLGNSVYSFSTVLFSVLLGMAIGAVAVDRARGRLVRLVIGTQVTMVAAGLTLTQCIDYIPEVFNAVGKLSPSFSTREAIKFATTAGTLLLPCLCLGVLFPALIVLLSPVAQSAGKQVGTAYATNTCGAVVGSIVTGFFILPLLGSKGTLYLFLAVNASIATFLVRRTTTRRVFASRTARVAAVLAGASLLLHPSWSWRRLLQATGVYFSPMPTSTFSRILANQEDVHGGVTTVIESPENVRFLLSNGKFQGDDGPEIADQYGFALITELHPHGHRRALNIGVGVGGTLGVLSLLPYEQVDAAEIAEPIIHHARQHFSKVNFGALDKPNVKVHMLDGRHLLSLLPATTKYDVITIQVTSVWFAGAGNLYSSEFYRLIAAHLANDGVVQQWVQLHHMRQEDLLVILKTLRSVFPYVELFVPKHQGILIASKEPLTLDAAHLEKLEMPAPLAERGLDFEDLAGSLLLGPAEIDDLLQERARGLALSTDDVPYLEYATPKGNALGFNFSENVTMLLEHRKGSVAEHLSYAGASPAARERLELKIALRELQLYRPYTLPWLRMLNGIAAKPQNEDTRARFASLLRKWSGQ